MRRLLIVAITVAILASFTYAAWPASSATTCSTISHVGDVVSVQCADGVVHVPGTFIPNTTSTSTTLAPTTTITVAPTTTVPPTTTTTVPSSRRVIWSAGMEAGNLNEWSLNGGGGLYNSGSFTASASTAVAHSGAWSLKGTITTPFSPSSGVRAFRWDEARKNRDAYYSVWLYVPQGAKVTGNYWNVFQFKSRTTDGSRVDPLWAFYAVSDANGIYLHAGWGWGSTPLAGPHATDGVSGKWYEQANRVYLPQGRWTHLEAFLHESTGTDFSGRLTFWQDSQQLFDLQNVRTTFNNCNYNTWCADDEWSVNVYSDGMSPSPFTAYFDDASISLP